MHETPDEPAEEHRVVEPVLTVGALRLTAGVMQENQVQVGPVGKLQAPQFAVGDDAEAGAASIIAGYRPIRTEIDPTPAMEALHAAGARLCVPVIEAAGRPLKFREWTPGCAMEAGPFGAEVPAAGEWLEPEVLIVPLVGWDREGWRLGYGGGFYDRTLELLRAKRPTLAIGFAYAAQELDAAPREVTDQQLDAVVTETGLIIGCAQRRYSLKFFSGVFV